jgi:hypothetical protein
MQEEKVMQTAVDILEVIFTSIDFENMSNSRKLAIWDEFKNKVKGAALSAYDLGGFVESICKKFNISGIKKDYAVILNAEQDSDKILEIYREQLMMCIFKLRMKREQKKEEYAKKKAEKAEKAKRDSEEYIKKMEEADDEYFAF